MIPQAIASSGARADLWSNFKSMAYAIERVSHAESYASIAELDKIKLLALAKFLEKETESRATDEATSFDAFLSNRSADSYYPLEVDTRKILENLQSYRNWLKSLPYRDKVAKLTSTLRDFVEQLEKKENLFPKVPAEQFTILSELLSKLVRSTESALID